jgi:DNA invertase Pin-like site-specific DNA recombinase
MRTIIYTRTRSGTGADRQLEQCCAFVASRGWDVTGEFTDTDASAWNLDRPGLQQAMQQVRTRGCDALIAQSASKLTRNASDLASILADADATGVGVLTADGILDTSDEIGVTAARIAARFAVRWDEDHASAD